MGAVTSENIPPGTCAKQRFRSGCANQNLPLGAFSKIKEHLLTYEPSEDSDQPAHSRSLIRIFTGRILDNQGGKVSQVHADNEDSYKTVQMRRLIWVFVRRTCQKVRCLTLWLIS